MVKKQTRRPSRGTPRRAPTRLIDAEGGDTSAAEGHVMSDKDRLTGMTTDQYLRGDLDTEMARARRFNRELAFILFEPYIDDPARNDYLYPVLKGLARTIEPTIRDIDISVRWGQQVLLVLPETGRAGAETVQGKVVERFAQLKFEHPESGRELPVTLRSVVLVFPHDGGDKETILYNLREKVQAKPQEDSPEAPSA